MLSHMHELFVFPRVIRKEHTSVSELKQNVGDISHPYVKPPPTLNRATYRRRDVTAAPFSLTWKERFENWSLVQMEHAQLSRYT